MSLSMPNTCRTDTFMSGRPAISWVGAVIDPPRPQDKPEARNLVRRIGYWPETTRKPVRCDSCRGGRQLSHFFIALGPDNGSARGRTLEFDTIAFRVGQIDRRPLPVRPESGFFLTAIV